jgi:predicted permease
VTTAARRAAALAKALHRAALWLAPGPTRRDFRDEMTTTFAEAIEAAAARGVVEVGRGLIRELRDLTTARRANRVAPLALPSSLTGDSPRRRLMWPTLSSWRIAARALARRPAYAVAVGATLAGGVALATVAFAIVDTVVIKSLPYPDADRLVTVYESNPTARDRTSLVAPARLRDWRQRSHLFAALSGLYTENVTDTSGADPERLDGRRVLPQFFEVYGVAPAIGRTFTADEEAATGPGAAVLSDRFWARRFGRERDAVGRALVIGGRPFTIVGVMPPAFTSGGIDVWLPAQIATSLMEIREARFLGGIGRLRPGTTLDAARSELEAIQAALGREFPASDAGWSAELQPLKAARIGDAGQAVWLLFGAVAALWLVAIGNVAGLTLVHFRRRASEVAIRTALGASGRRVVAALAREGILISTLGAAIGLLLATWMIGVVPSVLSRTPRIAELTLDARAILFAIALSGLAAICFSILPAWFGVRPARRQALTSEYRTVTPGGHRVQGALVVGQVALSVLLVASALLLLRGYRDLTQTDPGFNPAGVITFHVGARWDEDRTQVGLLQERLLAAVAAQPHVAAAGMANFLPATGATLRYQVRIDGLAGPNPDGSMSAGARMIAGHYLSAIGARLVAGSECPRLTTDAAAPLAAVVNRRFADTYSAGQPLLGRGLRMPQGVDVTYTIAGIVDDIVEDGAAAPRLPYVYFCTPAGGWPDPEYVVRTSNATALSTDLRRILREIDRSRAVFGWRTVEDVLDAGLERPRLDAAALSGFAVAAVALAALGLYSLFMLVVSERTREISLRLAIGAAPAQIMTLVAGGAGRLLTLGLSIGVALTLLSSRLLQSVVSSAIRFDALTVAVAAAVLIVVSIAAVFAPARRAARIAPVQALRD